MKEGRLVVRRGWYTKVLWTLWYASITVVLNDLTGYINGLESLFLEALTTIYVCVFLVMLNINERVDVQRICCICVLYVVEGCFIISMVWL